jgi:hypothetical protein
MSSSSSMVHFSSSESGTCEYEIIGNDSVNSTINWHFIQRRKFIRNTYGIPVHKTFKIQQNLILLNLIMVFTKSILRYLMSLVPFHFKEYMLIH